MIVHEIGLMARDPVPAVGVGPAREGHPPCRRMGVISTVMPASGLPVSLSVTRPWTGRAGSSVCVKSGFTGTISKALRPGEIVPSATVLTVTSSTAKSGCQNESVA